ncbi:MAG TPA: cation-efflux pump [Roseiarcus sp.]|jgi:cation diffusion facilitator family transporter
MVEAAERGQKEAPSRRKRRAALASVGASFALTLVKFAAGLTTGSLALLSEAAHNTLDIGASAVTYVAVREADKPADEDHPFGHAKIEAVAALAQTGFLLALSVAVAVEALRRIGGEPQTVDANLFGFAAILLSIGVDVVRYLALTRLARETRSDALAADALHYSSDLVSSALVLVGLAATRWGWPHADAFAAIGVAAFIAVAGFRLGRRTIDALVDAAPKGLAEAVRATVRDVPGVAGTEFLRLRRSGALTIGELGLYVSRTLPLERVSAIKADVADAIARRWPDTALTLTADPLALDDETVLERVQVIAARRRLFVHRVAVQNVADRKSVTLDLEVDGRMSLGAAHDIASQLERAITDEIGPDIEVETHIEPMEMFEIGGSDADPSLTRAIAEALARAATRDGVLRDVHDVRVRAASNGHIVIFHCRVDPSIPVEAAHERVDAIERSIRDEFPSVVRTVGHAEPAR